MTVAKQVGFGVMSRKDNQASFVRVLPPARNTITMETRKVPSKTGCAIWCFNTDSCCYFVYASDTEECTMKKMALSHGILVYEWGYLKHKN